ncbi:hypothetical protein [Bacillus weihaiensis]|uniref:Uncharacterized protein n=1 Tax=Bacillus weihaiensis TaxID=1547283 RepID=A0A1L3MW93_9BACI|nr:hypothetical protein [Bacillus weihaiensis]APH06611.1 hypothetical protein A9C19_18970 [Bacillus weihaiensis]
MIYYLFEEGERLELESILTKEQMLVDKLLVEKERENHIIDRALKERRDILDKISRKISK